MSSIINQGIFTGQGLIAFVFLGFAFFLFYKGRDKTNPSTKTNKKIYIGAIVSLLIGIVLLIIYAEQIKGAVA